MSSNREESHLLEMRLFRFRTGSILGKIIIGGLSPLVACRVFVLYNVELACDVTAINRESLHLYEITYQAKLALQFQHVTRPQVREVGIDCFLSTSNNSSFEYQGGQYLDENKQLILAILDNQNLGKMNECAAYQAKLQANLMYLAAIADSQPQPPPVHPQVPPAAVMPGGLHYMAHQQAQQQMAQQQALMAARNPMQYPQSSLSSMHHSVAHHQQQQLAMAAHHGVNSAGNSSLGGLSSGPTLGGTSALASGGFPDFARAGSSGEDMQVSRGLGGDMRGNIRPDGVSGVNSIHAGPGGGSGGNGSGHVSDDPEASYLKASEEEGN